MKRKGGEGCWGFFRKTKGRPLSLLNRSLFSFQRHTSTSNTNTSAIPRRVISPEHFFGGLLSRALHRAYPVLTSDVQAAVTPGNAARTEAAYQSHTAFVVGKTLKENPKAIAERIVQFLRYKESSDGADIDPDAFEALEKVNVERGGFINLHLKSTWIAARVRDARFLINKNVNTFPFEPDTQGHTRPQKEGDVLVSTQEDGHAHQRQATKKNILIDFASPNMAKELHVGHLRSIVQGDALSRLLEYVGHPVDRISHVGDFGTPLGMVVAHMLDNPTQRNTTAVPSPAELSEIYVEAKKIFDSSPDFAKRALEVAAELQKGGAAEKNVLDTYQRVCEGSRRGFDEIYGKLGVHVQERGESQYAHMLEGIIDELLQKGIATVSDGAICVFLEGSSAPLIVRKGDGAYLYSTTDLAALKQRAQELKKDWIVYVTDDSQREHFRMVFEIAKKAGWYDPQVTRVEHAYFGLVHGEDGQRLRSRDGTPAKLLDLLNEAVKQSRAVIRTSKTLMQAEQREYGALPSWNPGATQEPNRSGEEDLLAERIGYAAIKYFELSHNRSSNYIFSYPAMLSFKGNTAVYLLYAFTRIQSIRRQLMLLAKAEGGSGTALEAESLDIIPTLTDKEEQELGLLIAHFPDIVLHASNRLHAHQLCDYLYKLAGKFHIFYERCRVLGNDKTKSRLQLCFAVEGVLERGMRLLGVTPVDKM